ncbi:DUF1569 domain-containing protein [Pararhodonellum marinum]|uniref:DUF1569 domain-containing protein n=1 Tax=Pararhodonellum marinum TaxID=2755358 RepID=UPI00188FC150|nr:DUF1569 domain-containing protein [Pararhodonellum marinum]
MKTNDFIQETLAEGLDRLTVDHKALFGLMGPQHMVEHLILTFKLSVGRIAYPEVNPTAEALLFKQRLLYTDAEMRRGIKHPHSNDTLPALRFEHLEQAKAALGKAWEEFKNYYSTNPTAQHTHPLFGHLNHSEWLRFHDKHIRHHFRQFGLIKESTSIKKQSS